MLMYMVNLVFLKSLEYRQCQASLNSQGYDINVMQRAKSRYAAQNFSNHIASNLSNMMVLVAHSLFYLG